MCSRARSATSRAFVPALGLALLCPTTVLGQHAGIGYQTQAWSPDGLERFHGAQLSVSWESGPELDFELGLARWATEGTSCAGLVLDPSSCVWERMNAGSEALAMSFGYALFSLGLPRGEVLVIPSVGFAFANVQLTGVDTGGRKSDRLFLFEIGVAARYQTGPLAWGLVGLFAELGVSAGKDGTGTCADCYDPLRDGASRRTLVAGVTIGR